MKLKHFSKTVVGLVRKANEDHIGSLTNDQTSGNGDIFVVCDGMGGHVGGATASKKAVECILEYFKNDTHPNPILALEKAISFANEQIFLLSQDNPELKGMGTTCTALLQKDDNVYIAHVGDSRIYLNTDSKLYRVTKDHSFVQKLVDAGQLADSEMENHPRKNELTRALGISSNVEVEVSEKPLIVKNGDKFLMCSDGLCGLVNDPTISHVINKEKEFEAVDELIQLALNAGGNDNISVDIIEVVSSPHLKTIFKDQTNNNSNLSETQVFDASTFKKDRNLLYVLNRYKYYVLSFLIIIMSSIYLISSDLLGLNPPSTSNPNEGNTGLSVIDSTNTNPLAKQEDNSNSTKIIINDPNEDIDKRIAIEKEAKRIAVEERAAKSEREAAEAAKLAIAETAETKAKAEREIAAKEKAEREAAKEKAEREAAESKANAEREAAESKANAEREAAEKPISNGEKIIEKLENIIKENKIYSDYVKDKINALKKSFESYDISIINEKTKDLENIKNELNDRIFSEKSKFIVYQPYKWDLKKCGIKSDSHFGTGKMYFYNEGDKEIDIIYLKEKKVIDSLENKGYQLSGKKENVLKKEKDNGVISAYKVFFSKKKYTANQLRRLTDCSGESKNQIYVLKI